MLYSMVKPKVVLHLGVHKTATTYVQSRLWNSLEELERNRVNYIGLNSLRKRLTSRLGDASFGKKDVFDALYPFLNCDRLILSDENILGGTNAPRYQAFYPWAKERFKKVLRGLEGCEVEVYVTLRSFPEYLISRYTESLRHFKFFTFEDYMSGIDAKNISWLPLLDDLLAAGCGKIFVNDFNYVVSGDEYIYRLIGKEVELNEASQGSRVRRSKVSNEAYEILKLYGSIYSDQSTRRLISMMDDHPQHTEATPFMPFTENQLFELNTKYKKELSVVKDDPRFNFIPG
ncbi:hypothetical protein [Halomonas sp. B23F22_10]|uniref:hypothetical protein n=1 Tax=Halomonas sp. B23F22_10 TaxID=3459515 RepID=UPI00373E31D3